MVQIPAVIGTALTPVLNASFCSGVFPKPWKKALILPLLKKQTLGPGDPNSYRPISRLPFPAKVLEKAMNNQLNVFLQSSISLDPSQYGFRANHSTELALVKSTEEIREALDRGGNAVLILLDLSAAFDTVHHEVLMDRLSDIGVKAQAWRLLKSFLSERSQTVDFEGNKSQAFSLPCGVPQGSSLSPTFFNIYVAPLAGVIRSFGFLPTTYADDTQIVVAIKEGAEKETGIRFHDCMSAVSGWMAANCLKLNSNKTEVLKFGNNPHVWTPDWWPEDLGHCPTLSGKAKNVGVYVDTKITMADQISMVSSACFLILRILRKIKSLLTESSLKTVVTALVMSRLDYCNGLYLNAQRQHINRLQLVQNAAARLLTGIPKFVSVKKELRQLHWLPVRHRIRFKALCTTFKALNNTGPDFLKHKFQWYLPKRTLRSAEAKLIQVPSFKKASWGGRSFVNGACRAWNELPYYLRNTSDLLSFKKDLKTWLFSLE